MRDYAAAFMPDLPFDRLISARKELRAFAQSLGIVVGEELTVEDSEVLAV